MLIFIKSHPYIVGGILSFFILFFIGIFALEASLGESLLGSAVLSAVGTGAIWWKQVGLG